MASADISESLSGDEVNRLAGGGCRVVRYPELASFSSWNELVDNPGKAAIILFLVESESEGHWICAFEGSDGPHVFDPLGYACDAERSRLTPEKLAELGETQPQMRRLLNTADGTAHVSRNDFQQDKPGINTCGRWVGLRIQNRDLTDPQFKAFVQRGMSSTGLKADAWVVQVTAGRGEAPTADEAMAAAPAGASGPSSGAGLDGGSLDAVSETPEERARKLRGQIVAGRLARVRRAPLPSTSSDDESTCDEWW